MALLAHPRAISRYPRLGSKVLLLGAAIGLAGALIITILAGPFSPLMAFFGVAALLVVAGMLASPAFAVLVMCFSLPFERIGRLTDDVDPVAISASRIFGILALTSFLIHIALRKRKLRFGLPFWLYAGYTAVALLSNAWAASPEETYRDSFRIVGNLLFFVLIINAVRTYDAAKKTVIVWVLASLVAGAFSLGDYYFFSRNIVGETEMGLTSQRRATVLLDGAESRAIGVKVKRLFGTTAHPTLFGLNMLMIVPFLLWLWYTSRGWIKLIWAGGMVVSVFSVVLSNTRAVFLLAVVTVLMCFWRRLWRPNLQALAALAALIILMIPFIPEDVYRRVLDPELYTAGKADGIRVRLKYWEKSWEIIQENWMHGIGVGNQTLVPEMVTDEVTGNLTTVGLRASAHNEYITVMSEVGIVGYVLHWGFVGLVTAAGFRAASRFRRDPHARNQYLFCLACQVLMIGITLFAVQSEVFHYPLKGWWLVAGLACTMLDLATGPMSMPDGREKHAAP